jgi:hypothetical protein
LDNCQQITDRGLADVAELPRLKELTLSGCELVTDAGLAHLEKLDALEYIQLENCPQVTGNAVDKLQSALPNCRILQ